MSNEKRIIEIMKKIDDEKIIKILKKIDEEIPSIDSNRIISHNIIGLYLEALEKLTDKYAVKIVVEQKGLDKLGWDYIVKDIEQEQYEIIHKFLY